MLSAHPTSVLLQAYADGEIAPARRAALMRHVSRCAACAGQLEQVRALTADFAGMVGSIDAAGAAALQRLSQSPPARPHIAPVRADPRRQSRTWLRAASTAALLLVGGTVAGLSALWLRDRLVAEPEAVTTVTEEAPVSTSGISVLPRLSSVRIRLVGLAPGSQVMVQVTESDSVSVDVRSAGGAVRFAEREDGIEATVDGSAEVVVALPRAISRATVTVDGVLRATKDARGISIPLPSGAVTVQAR